MKRFTLSFLTLWLALMASAEPIGRQAALYTARSYMLAKGKTIDSQQTSVNRRQAKSNAGPQPDEEAYYYVFNAGNDGGYVIVSGDDRIDPIIGYVEQGSFDPDNIPENMQAYLESFTEEIKYVIDNDLQPTSPQLKRRSKASVAKHSIPELLTTRWNQNLPYNLTIPKYYKGDGSQARPATGCIATAWAQVVAFHRYPDKIKVAIPSYSKTFKLDDGTEKTVTYKAIPRNTPIDWDNICDTYSCSESHAHTAQDTAVADLMRYCGYAVKMSYGGSSSASYRTSDFIKYFGFDDGANRISRDDYDIDGWVDVIYNELAEGYPMPVAGTKVDGAHAFVIDGFDGDNLFHVNWGWGGQSNGWFLLGILNRWNRGNGAIINLRRPDNIKAEPTASLTINDVVTTSTGIKATFVNNTDKTATFHTGIVKIEDDGSLTLVGTKQNINSMADDASATKTFQIKGNLPEGTYKLSPASKLSTGQVWHPKYNLRDQYVEAVVDADGEVAMRIIEPVIDISIDTIVFSRLRVVGQEQKIDVTFRNNGDEYYHDVFLFASKTQEKVYQNYMFRVAAHKGETVTYPFYFTPEETGIYNLWFCTNKNGNGEVGRGTIEILTEEEAAADRANLAITYSIVNGKDNTAYGNRLYGKATIKNNGSKDFHGSIELELWHQKKTASSAVSGPSKSFSLDIAAGKTAIVNYEFDNLSCDYYYRFKASYGTQSGNLSGGGIWDYKCDMQDGVVIWKNDGSVSGKAYGSTLLFPSNSCGLYADCSKKINRVTPNSNPNTIYAFASGMEVPATLNASNVVSGNSASRISLVGDYPYFVPVSFRADSASFTYTFPETEAGTGWHAFTLPFRADSIFVDDEYVALDDENKHFVIYEFSAQGNNGEVIFAPATELRAETPYIIAADATMAGRSLIFRSQDVPFSKSGSSKMVVTTPGYQFHGITLAPKVKECYVLNEDGTAFEYVTTNTDMAGLASYFTTSLSEEARLPSIVLPAPPFQYDPTSMNEELRIKNEEPDAAIYDLSGRKIVNCKLPKGIYIVNGRKLLK